MARSVLLLQNANIGSDAFPAGDIITAEDDVADDLVLNGQAVEVTVNGTSSISSGTSSVAVVHGLGHLPNAVYLTGQHAETAAIWATGVTSSGFTANVAVNTTGSRGFYWGVD
jgi:hypothetical protein